MNYSAEGGRMTVEIISRSISTNVWDLAWIKLVTLDLQSNLHLLPDTLLTALCDPVENDSKIIS